MHSLLYLHLVNTLIHFLCVHMCPSKSSRVDSLKLHGGDAFHSCPHIYTVRCTRMLILSHFTCMHAQPLQTGFVCFSLSCKSLHTNACFLSSCNKGHISSLCVYIVFVQMHFICLSTEICCATVLPIPAYTCLLPW